MSARRVSLGDASRVGLGLPDAVVAVGLQHSAMGAQAMLGGQIGGFMGHPGQAGSLGGLIGGIMPVQQPFGIPANLFGNMPAYGRMGW
jgi:hypothetical protein